MIICDIRIIKICKKNIFFKTKIMIYMHQTLLVMILVIYQINNQKYCWYNKQRFKLFIRCSKFIMKLILVYEKMHRSMLVKNKTTWSHINASKLFRSNWNLYTYPESWVLGKPKKPRYTVGVLQNLYLSSVTLHRLSSHSQHHLTLHLSAYIW